MFLRSQKYIFKELLEEKACELILFFAKNCAGNKWKWSIKMENGFSELTVQISIQLKIRCQVRACPHY